MEAWESVTVDVAMAGLLAVSGAQCIFLQKFLGAAKWKAGLFFLLQAAGYSLTVFWDGWGRFPYLLRAAAHHLVFLWLVLLLFRGSRGRRLLAASLLLAAYVLGGPFWESLFCLLLLLGIHAAAPEPGLVLGAWGGCLAAGLGLALTALGILGLCRFGSCCLDGEEERPGSWYVLLAVPLLGFSGVADVAGWGASHGILVRSGGWLDIYYDQLLSYGGMCILTALAMAAAGFYLRGMVQMEREQQKSRRYQAQLAVYRMLEEQHRQSESLRHDMKNHILALTGLWEGQEWERLGEYLGQLTQAGGLGSGQEATGNRVVDTLLCQKGQTAREEGISWECCVNLPSECRIREMDWCILLGNLMDNAIRACSQLAEKERRFICLKGGRVKGCFLLEVENSVAEGRSQPDGVMRQAEGAGKHPGEAKHQAEDVGRKHLGGGRQHEGDGKGEVYGIGLRNVQDLVERYNGILRTERRDGVFAASVLLPLELVEPAQDMKPAV